MGAPEEQAIFIKAQEDLKYGLNVACVLLRGGAEQASLGQPSISGCAGHVGRGSSNIDRVHLTWPSKLLCPPPWYCSCRSNDCMGRTKTGWNGRRGWKGRGGSCGRPLA